MINPVAKGYRNEKRCMDDLKSAGYIVFTPPRTRFGKQDIFGLFDVLAAHSPKPPGHPLHGKKPEWGSPLLIQVKSNKCPAATRRAISEFDCGKQFVKMIWVWEDYRGWIQQVIT